MSKFKIGDQVRCIESNPDVTAGEVYEVTSLEVDVHGRRTLDLIRVRRSNGSVTSAFMYRFELVQSAAPTSFRERLATARAFYAADQVKVEFKDVPPAPATQALRYNQGKFEADYILTFVGGVDAAFREDFIYLDTMRALGVLYRSGSGQVLQYEISNVLETLRDDAAYAGDNLVELLAGTATTGAAKYEAFNYLKGAPWRQHFQCTTRHALKIDAGEEWDYDAVAIAKGFPKGFNHRGNFFFNVIRACHEMAIGIGTDDRPVTVLAARLAGEKA